MNIHEIVKKLIGPTWSMGEHNADQKRLENLEQIIELVDKLVSDIHLASLAKNRTEDSMRTIGERADKFLHSLREELEENEYLTAIT